MARRVTYWQPMRDMITLRQAMDRLFDEGLVRPEWAEQRERAARLPSHRDVIKRAAEWAIERIGGG